MTRPLVHVALWAAVLVFWVVAARGHHPTWLLDIVASTVLVGASAAAVYFNALVLRGQPLILRGIKLALVVALLDVAAVLLIQTAYDLLWGPDPARYGFWTNVRLEAAFIGVHLGLAIGGLWILRRIAGVSGKSHKETA